MVKNPQKNGHGPFFVKFDGLHASVRSINTPNKNIKSMLVSHAFVELLKMITEDQNFDKSLFEALTENERDFMKYALLKCKIQSRGFDTAYNQTISHYVNRLSMLYDAVKIGNDNPVLKNEITELLEKLYEKNVFSRQYYSQLKRSLNNNKTTLKE